MNAKIQRIVTIIFCMLLVVNLSMLLGSNDVEASTTQYPGNASRDGYLAQYVNFFGTNYYSYTSASITVGCSGDGSITTYNYRGYASFDTSGIPDSATLSSATIYFRLQSDLTTTGELSVMIYDSDYGTLGTSDWTAYSTYLGRLFYSYGLIAGNWYSMNLPTNVIDKVGYSEFCLKATNEGTGPTTMSYISLYSSDSAYAPYIEVSYSVPGTEYNLELDSGAILSGELYPNIEDWNTTYDLWQFEIDTVPNSKNLTVVKADNWVLRAIAPYCNYSDNSTAFILSDVYDSICYRIWFTVPISDPQSSVHVAIFNAFTGEGFFWESFRVQYSFGTSFDNTSAFDLPMSDFYLPINSNVTFRVFDFFGNSLIDYSASIYDTDTYLSIPVPVYSWQIFNMNGQPVLVKIFWNNSGSPMEFFVGPSWIIERFVKGGNYTFHVTYYSTDGTVGDTVYFNRTIPMIGLNASFIYVNGTTLYEIVTDIAGLQSTQEIITNLLTPDIIYLYSDVPTVPDQYGIARQMSGVEIYSVVEHAYEIVTATVYDNQSGTDLSFYQPYESKIGVTTTVLYDVLTFSGPYDTQIWVNMTDGTVLYNLTTLPATLVNLNGNNITIESDNPISVSRQTIFKHVGLLTWTYNSYLRYYSLSNTLYNNLSVTAYNVYWSMYFQNPDEIDIDTLTVLDNLNSIYLVLGTNYDVSTSGVHFYFNSLTSGNYKSLTLNIYDRVDDVDATALASITSYVSSSSASYCGEGYLIATGLYANSATFSYTGDVIYKLDFENAEKILPSSIAVWSVGENRLLNGDEWYYQGGTVTILDSAVGIIAPGESVTFLIAFQMDSDRVYTLGLTKPIFIFLGATISLLTLICFISPTVTFLVLFLVPKKHRLARRWDILVMVSAVAAIVYILGALGVLN